MKNKKYILISILYVFLIIFMCKCYSVDLSSNIMYEYDGKDVQAVLYTSCAASGHSIDVYNSEVKDVSERGYKWIDLKKTWVSPDDPSPTDSSYYTITGLSFHKQQLVRYDTTPTNFNVSGTWFHIYYDKYVSANNPNTNVDTTIRKSSVDKIKIVGQKANLTKKSEKIPLYKVYALDSDSAGTFNSKYLIEGNKIICKYYIKGIEDLIEEDDYIYWSTIVKIKADNGSVTSKANEITNSYDLIKAIYFGESLKWRFGFKRCR